MAYGFPTTKQLLADDPASNPGTNRTFQRL